MADGGDAERRARSLVWATIAWNLPEAVVSIGLGIAAGSLALIGFGADSVIELFASLVVVWHLRGGEHGEHAHRIRATLRLLAAGFCALAVSLAVAGISDLVGGRRAEGSPWGIAYMALTVAVMLTLGILKRRSAADLASSPLRSEATMSVLDGVLAAATLAGLVLNAWLGWWWADPSAAFVVALFALGEARENWEEAGSLAGSG
jgi:divalent metal cation (Fe/Co/Zn/Cd) transporter